MRRGELRILFNLLIILLIVTIPILRADQLKKEYFKLTLPGSWAKQEMSYTSGGEHGKMVYTYTRYNNSNGQVVCRFDINIVSGAGAGGVTTMYYVLEPGFDFSREILEYGKYIQTHIVQYNDGEYYFSQHSVVESINMSSSDYSNAFKFVQSKIIDGAPCDLYKYSAKSISPNVTISEGEMCLSETVPFAVIYQSGKVKESGNIISDFKIELTSLGEGAVAPAKLISMIPSMNRIAVKDQTPDNATGNIPVVEVASIKDVFQNEFIRIKVDVEEGTGGKRLLFTLINKADNKLRVTIPTTKTELKVGLPVNVLLFRSETQQLFEIEPGESAVPVRVVQLGNRIVEEGSFELSVYQGTPLFSGSATMETVN